MTLAPTKTDADRVNDAMKIISAQRRELVDARRTIRQLEREACIEDIEHDCGHEAWCNKASVIRAIRGRGPGHQPKERAARRQHLSPIGDKSCPSSQPHERRDRC